MAKVKVSTNRMIQFLSYIAGDKEITPFYRLHALDRLAVMGKVYNVDIKAMDRPRLINPPHAPVEVAVVETKPEGHDLLDAFNRKFIGGGNLNAANSNS